MKQLKKLSEIVVLVLLGLSVATGAPLSDKKESMKRLAGMADLSGGDEEEFSRIVANVKGNVDFIIQEIDNEKDGKYVSFLISILTLGTQGDEREQAQKKVSDRLSMLDSRKNYGGLIQAFDLMSDSTNEAYVSKLELFVNHQNKNVKKWALFSKKKVEENIQKSPRPSVEKSSENIKAGKSLSPLEPVASITNKTPNGVSHSEPESKPAIPLWAIILGGIVLLGLIATVVKRK